MQGLVYIFIALAALAIGAAAYFGLTFSPIDAMVTALSFGVLAVVLMERTLRQRSEARLEKAIEDLSRLLSTDAQAGAVLSQRLNNLAETNAGRRLESVEADVSVLGAVVRQVAEAVADIEEARRTGALPAPLEAVSEPAPFVVAPAPAVQPISEDAFPEPVIPLELVRQAIDDGRLVMHLDPVLTLPQRRVQGHDLVPRLLTEDGDFANPPDFLPRHGGEALLRRIEKQAAEEAVAIARRAKTDGQAIVMYLPLTRATLGDALAVEELHAVLDANKAIADLLVFAIPETDWRDLRVSEKSALAQVVARGVTLSMRDARTLRFDFAELSGEGFSSVRIDAPRFIAAPGSFADFHAADIVNYVRRYGIDLIATGISGEQHIISLLDDGFALAQGPYLAGIGPVRADLLARRLPEPEPRTATAARS